MNVPRPAGGVVGGAGAQLTAVSTPALMIAANAVAEEPTSTDRLSGRAADTMAEAERLRRPIWFTQGISVGQGMLLGSANQMPPGPAAMPAANANGLNGVGITYSLIAPAVVIRPILVVPVPIDSMNQRAPSGPAVMD